MLVLVPSPLSQTTPLRPVLDADLPLIRRCQHWLVENAKPARAAMKLYDMPLPVRDLTIVEIGRSDSTTLRNMLKASSADSPLGLMSDAGCPGIADPGASVVELAHKMEIPVVPLVGPSSIVLGLMASGFSGQAFEFHGYLPVQPAERNKAIESTERQSKAKNSTQIAIETPFRNEALYKALVETLAPNSELCMASDLTGDNVKIQRKTVAQWRKENVSFEKVPTLFLWMGN